ncbi:MAG TPA: sigma 54-interacting transcriptional regulator [Candidatus Methanoperedens sp.]|nr:sigma 54-interacting transcriptional regulator [Candidatus Methanoperedens sp.]
MQRQAQDPRFLLNIFETMREGVMVIDEDGNIVYFNKAAEEISGFPREEVLGKSCVILDSDTCVVLTPEGKQRKCDLFKGATICNKRCRIKARDGTPVYLLKNAVLLRDEGGEIIGAVETMTDVTSLYMKELELEELKEELRQEYWFMGLLGWSSPMQRLYEQIRNAALSEAPVLITGESGTGKNLTANAIHALGRRREKPFVKMNCSALNENLLESELFGHKKGSFTGALSDRVGRFEAADGGSILLDEIGDMSPLMQAKLLRVLEEKVVERVGENEGIPVNVRIISATNRDLPELIREGRFREDLFYRVNAISIRTPALRERPDDIPTLTSHFLKKISVVNNKDVRRVSPRAMDLLCNYRWPGNVRQLMSALEHSAITCSGDTVEISDLPDYLFQPGPEEPAAKGDERARLDAALALHKGNKTLAAKHLGISRVTLWKKLKALNPE